MANFSAPAVHAVEKISAIYDPDCHSVDLRMTGSGRFTGPNALSLPLFLCPDVPPEYGERLAAAINQCNAEVVP